MKKKEIPWLSYLLLKWKKKRKSPLSFGVISSIEWSFNCNRGTNEHSIGAISAIKVYEKNRQLFQACTIWNKKNKKVRNKKTKIFIDEDNRLKSRLPRSGRQSPHLVIEWKTNPLLFIHQCQKATKDITPLACSYPDLFPNCVFGARYINHFLIASLAVAVFLICCFFA